MSAKHKLNSANFVGAVGVAALLGFLTSSVAVFFLTALVLVGASMHAGDIRG